MAKRHDLVLEAIDSTVGNAKATKPYRMLEIGVYAGDNAVRMVKHAMNRGRPNVNYYGVDLFEDLTPTKSKEEMSKAKLPPSIKEVRDKVRKVTKGCWIEKGCSFEVIKANALTNIPQQDVIFVDGGHSLETIYQDWMAIQPLMHEKTVVVFDDYYHNRNDYGCSRLIDFLLTDPVFSVVIADHIDTYPNTKLDISCAMVTRVSNELALPVPNSVRGKAEWSDLKLEGTPKGVVGDLRGPDWLKEVMPAVPVTDPAVIEKMAGQDGPVVIQDAKDMEKQLGVVEDNPLSEGLKKAIKQGDDSGKSETKDGHLPEGGETVPAGGGSGGADSTEQHSGPSPVLRPERGAEDGAVGERSEDVGRESTTITAGDIGQLEISAVRAESAAGDNDQASANPAGSAETGGAAGE